MKLVRTVFAALAVLAISATLAQAGPLAIGAPVPTFKLKDLDGKEVEVTYDKKVNVISFWVSTCTLCNEELGAINNLSEKFKDASFTVVSTDFGGARVVKYVLEETKVVPKVPILLDQGAKVAMTDFGATRFPTLVIVSKGGKVLWYGEGWEKDSAQRIESEIDFRLKQKD